MGYYYFMIRKFRAKIDKLTEGVFKTLYAGYPINYAKLFKVANTTGTYATKICVTLHKYFF
jgi:hypothetical protein